MSKLQWSQVGNRFFETGLDRGVLYLDDVVVPWNGLTSVEEDFSNDTSTPYFLDGVKYLDAATVGDFAATIKAFTYPDEFLEYEGVLDIADGLSIYNQEVKTFSLSYRTLIGNDTQGTDFAYKVHICYNLNAVQDDVTFSSMSESIDPIEFGWQVSSIPEEAPGYASTAHVILDSRYLDPGLLSDLEGMLYGTDDADPQLSPLSDLIPMVTPQLVIA